MKKVYDWNIEIIFSIQNNNKKIAIICSVHTTIHALKIEICKKLGYAPFDTEMDLYGGKETWRPMKPTSSLQQNGIEKSSASIKVVIKRVKKNPGIETDITNTDKATKKEKQTKSSVEDSAFGLNLEAACSNPKCVNYQQNIQINYGYGDFPIFQVISSLKCAICPYKNQHMIPTMMCKSIRVQKCLYKFLGTVPDRDGLPIDKTIGYIKAIQNTDILSKLSSTSWNSNLLLSIKHL